MADFDTTDFDAIKISLASADQIRSWSHGEVKKPETINYRTLKPEKEGLFCEKIFGPAKDWECSCGKYKGIRFKGITCERCGVEVTTAKVRRDRMGHIELACPVSHIWYFKSPTGYPISRILSIKSKDLEKVLYFASYIITSIDKEGRDADAVELKNELLADLEELDAELEEQIERVREQGEVNGEVFDELEPLTENEIREAIADLQEEYAEEKELRREAYDKFMQLKERELISDEALFMEMKRYYSLYFKGGMGAEAIRDLLRQVDLQKEAEKLREIISDPTSQKQKRETAVKRLSIVDAFLESGNDPADMILDVIPVIPPDLRPMVQLDGGRFAASDLNDLYRRVINRNNRLKRFLDNDAPASMINNEKRLVQESVDTLFDNGRRGRAVTGRGNRVLKSLAEALKGKQGRFRQNLLGKRVDYSGRSVIVVDPHLKLHECGLPKDIALELFKPFVMRRLVELGKADNIKGAKHQIETRARGVWDVLEEVIEGRVVLLNRAPTLHRLSIQAFAPVLVEGKAIHLHPLVCAPYNADFDGDQMSCHLPLSAQAQTEARILMLSSNNLRSPASGKVLTVPSQDMVFGVYYLTTENEGVLGEGKVFASFDDVLNAYDARDILDLQAKITVRVTKKDANVELDGRKYFRVSTEKDSFEDLDVTEGSARFETTCGRIIFNRQCLPKDYPYLNYKLAKGDISRLVNDCCDRYPLAQVAPILDSIKYAGFHYATRAGLTVSLWDAAIPEEKEAMLAETQTRVNTINENYEEGFLTERERHNEVVEAWNTVAKDLGDKMLAGFAKDNPIYMMADSGARGSKTQLRQLAGMRGLMADMSGETIDLPIKANFREGLKPLEYFISTYGARKGLVDTASHTSKAGYLTRRLVDAAQDVIVREGDCGTYEGCTYKLYVQIDDKTEVDLNDASTYKLNLDLIGRCLVHDVVSKATGEVVMEAGSYLSSAEDIAGLIREGIEAVELRAILQCRSKHGVCQKCYGWDLSTRRPVNIGTAVGIIAAQSIGEPGTQLTMRTIHSGGVAGADDITQGLPTVERMFDIVENINPKILGYPADIADQTGKLLITTEHSEYLLQIVDPEDPSRVLSEKRVPGSVRFMPTVKDGCMIHAGDMITKGFPNFKRIRELTDIESTMHAFVSAVKEVYSSQGVDLNDKHIEVISRQMLKRDEVVFPGDSKYLLGQYVDRFEFAETVEELIKEGKTPPEAAPTIMGVIKVAGSIDSWLSSGSFIRTAGILTSAAIRGDIDRLLDLKSNVIVGKKIPAGTGLDVYNDIKLTYKGQVIDELVSPNSKSLPSWAPDDLKELEEELPEMLDWIGSDYSPKASTRHTPTLSPEDGKLYLFDDLGVSQRWTNKFQEANIETVNDLVGKTEEQLMNIEGIGAKAIEELRAGLEKHGLLYILEPDQDGSDDEDFTKLLNMVFSPDSNDILLGTAIPSSHSYDGELLGSSLSTNSQNPSVINESLDSLDDLLHEINSHKEQSRNLFDDEF